MLRIALAISLAVILTTNLVSSAALPQDRVINPANVPGSLYNQGKTQQPNSLDWNFDNEPGPPNSTTGSTNNSSTSIITGETSTPVKNTDSSTTAKSENIDSSTIRIDLSTHNAEENTIQFDVSTGGDSSTTIRIAETSENDATTTKVPGDLSVRGGDTNTTDISKTTTYEENDEVRNSTTTAPHQADSPNDDGGIGSTIQSWWDKFKTFVVNTVETIINVFRKSD